MKNGITTQIDWQLIGAQLANEDADIQAKFINSMAKEMLSWDTRFQTEMQVSYIVNALTPEAKELFNFEQYLHVEDIQ